MDATLRFIGGASRLPDVALTVLSHDPAEGMPQPLRQRIVIRGRPVWHSISRYMPSPLEVLENAWILA